MGAARRILTLSLLLSLSACTASVDGPRVVSVDADSAGLGFDHATVIGMLRLANDPASDVPFLMDGVGLDNDAADAIVRHRQGSDRADGTWDDDPFDDGFELTDLPDLGPDSLHLLAAAAHDLDLVPDLVLEGVHFSRAQLEAALLLANEAPLSQLDGALDSRAAESLVIGRPYDTIFEVAERSWMGPASLEALRDLGSEWLDELPTTIEA